MMKRKPLLMGGLLAAGVLVALGVTGRGARQGDLVMIQAVPAHPDEVTPAAVESASAGGGDVAFVPDRTWADLGRSGVDSLPDRETLPDELRPARQLPVPPIPEPLTGATREEPSGDGAGAPDAAPDSAEVAGGNDEESPKENDVRDAPLVPPVLLKAAWLSYPREALKRKAQATVEVRILVGETGDVSQVELVDRNIDPELGQAALEAARSMKFRAATRGGNPVPVWYNYLFDFSLPRSG
jgi:TonB family protein